jgi:hypothetical protein
MSLNVAYSQNINKGIDTQALKEVTQQIFKRAESKSVDLSSLDLTKFKRADLGMDLYSGKVDSSTARQVSMANSGMQINLSENVVASLKFLNNEASKSIFKNVEGKMAPAVNEETAKAKNSFELPKFSQLIKTLDLSKDKNGSNPFHKGALVKVEKKEQEESINIFA